MNMLNEVLRLLTLNKNVLSIEFAKSKRNKSEFDEAVDFLNSVGYDIKNDNGVYNFVPHKSMTEQKIKALLKRDNVKIHVYDELASTNDTAMEIAQKSNGSSLDYEIIIASRQTAGKGRRGRSFYSPDSTGLYMSIILHPDMSIREAGNITAVAAVALSKAIEYITESTAQIKWVNDIFIDGKKVCGILAESSLNIEKDKLNYAVVGIGVNILPPQDGFPPELNKIAGAISDSLIDRSFFAATVINFFDEIYSNMKTKTFLSEYKNRQFILGKNINVIKSDSVKFAKAVDIDDECRLIVEYDDKTTEALYSGEVSVRPV